MKAAVLLTLATLVLGTPLPAFAQYSARTLTSKIVPQPQQPAPARPVPPQQYAPQPAAAAPARPLTEKEIAKVKADKSKNEVKQFEFYKRRAEEGSDHAQYELGMRYLTGKGTDPSEKLGREWIAKSAKQGYSQATKKLAELGPEPPETKVADAKSAEPAGTAAPATSKKNDTK